MGLLKHVVIPAYAALHIWAVYTVLIAKDLEGGIQTFSWPPKAGKDQSMTLWEKHLFASVAAAHASFLVACLLGIFHEHAHFRGIVVLMETVFWAIDSYDAKMLGFPYEVAVGFAVMGVVGLVVHSQEPGLFTKDKQKTKSS